MSSDTPQEQQVAPPQEQAAGELLSVPVAEQSRSSNATNPIMDSPATPSTASLDSILTSPGLPTAEVKRTIRMRIVALYHKYKPLLGGAIFFLIMGLIPSLILALQTENFLNLVEKIAMGGFRGQLAFSAFLTVWTIICFPTTIAELICGFTFGFGTSVLVSAIGKTLGSVLSFLLGKFVFKRWLAGKIEDKYPIMKALQNAVSDRPWTIIMITRLATLPIALKNYGTSVMPGVTLWLFFVCSLVGGLPFTLAWSYFGSASKDLVTLASGGGSQSPSQKAVKTSLEVMGGVFLVAFLVVMRYFTKRELKKLEDAQKAEDTLSGAEPATRKSVEMERVAAL